MTTTAFIRRSATAALLVIAVIAGSTAPQASALNNPTVRRVSIAYRAFDGRLSHAVVLLPAWYGPQRHPVLPLVISPHGRGLDGASNARRWGNLPGAGGFVVVNPDGEGAHSSGRFSWGARGQIDDLARMPAILSAALPWLHIDARRIYAVGGSMGGQETLLLLARHPRLLAGAVAVDAVVDLARQFRSSTGSRGATLRRLARNEVGGTPASDPGAFAARSPITYAAALAASGVPLQIWWTRNDRIVVHSQLQSGLLVTRIRKLDPEAPVTEVVGGWRHTAILRWDRSLPTMLARLGLLPRAPSSPATEEPSGDEIGVTGNAGHVPDSTKPKLTATFEHESYRAAELARLVVTDDATHVDVRFFRAGGENGPTVARDVMRGTPVSRVVPIGAVHGRLAVSLRIGTWPSGVYFAQLTAAGARVGYAPFVLAPRRLGEHRIAVVMPTQTWQAYNFRDDDGDGHPDTWYAGWKTHTARLDRPFLDRGVPPHWKRYDAPFVRWLAHTDRRVDYLSDAELRNARSGDVLARAYTLIVFSGHHEYVTSHEYDVVTRYRDVGGNLAFLAANNFFWKITIANHVMTRVAEWRDLGRPEAALIGVQYRANDRGAHRGPWILRRGAATTRWLFSRVEGGSFGNGGIEIDSTAASSPKNVRVLAEIPNLFGRGFTAQMTYYETPTGARVFAAGAFSLADDAWDPTVSAILASLWVRLSA